MEENPAGGFCCFRYTIKFYFINVFCNIEFQGNAKSTGRGWNPTTSRQTFSKIFVVHVTSCNDNKALLQSCGSLATTPRGAEAHSWMPGATKSFL